MSMIKTILHKLCNRETIAYLICGIITTLINIAVFWLCERMGWHVAVSNTVATVAAVSFAYFANKIIVFQSTSWAVKVLIKEISTFITGRFATFAMETILLVLLVDMAGLPSVICKAFTTGLVIVGNYLISKWAVFKKDKNTDR